MGKRDIPVVLTEEEQQKLLDQFNTRYVTSERNKVMFQLMLNTGLRVSEATSLRWEDVNLTSGKLMVREGKGAKDRTLWVDEGQLDVNYIFQVPNFCRKLLPKIPTPLTPVSL